MRAHRVAHRSGRTLPGRVSTPLPEGWSRARATRLLSRWQSLVDDVAPDPLATMEAEPSATTFVARAQPRAGRLIELSGSAHLFSLERPELIVEEVRRPWLRPR